MAPRALSHLIRWLPPLLALTSALALIAAFPPFSAPWLAWVALVPWLFLLRLAPPRAAFWWSCLAGFTFFLGSMWWLAYVTIPGWIVLSVSLGLYLGLFGWLVARTKPKGRHRRALRRWGWLRSWLLPPSLWVGLEYLRTHLFSGMGWNLLAYSQAPYSTMIQAADLTGAWGVSFLIVLVNVILAQGLWAAGARGAGGEGQGARGRGRGPRVTRRRAVIRALLSALCCVLCAAGYGVWRMGRLEAPRSVRVAVVQGNIPQSEKWDAAFQDAILDRYEALTHAALERHPDLIVWPETSVPGFLTLEEPVTQRVLALAASINTPLLVGTPMERLEGTVWRTTNSAALLDSSQLVRQRYDKMHLVPFGEYLPFERALPWLRALLPPIGEFSPGADTTVFRLENGARGTGHGARDKGDDGAPPEVHSAFRTPHSALVGPPAPETPPGFSALICFEDVFPELARRFVREGAQFLLVITNDGWFGPTGAPYQHAQASILRAVELRVPIARAANTGWSGCIDAAGRIRGRVADGHGRELYVSGAHVCDLPLPETGSLYRAWGDWFAWLCLLAAAALIPPPPPWRLAKAARFLRRRRNPSRH